MHLYKYMKLREPFFTEPMIRATPLYSLNDPFEGLFNTNQLKAMNEAIEKVHGKSDYQTSDVYDEEHDLHEHAGLMQQDVDDLGVLSFTEDYTNPLMWAHYAEEHFGIVVEFNFSEPFFTNSAIKSDERTFKFGENSFLGVYEFPQKIMYRRELPRFNRPDMHVPKDKHDYLYRSFKKSILFTKSNDWIYEKEHRSIVELCEADRFVCDDCEYIRNECSKDETIELVHDKETGKIQITFPADYRTYQELGDESIRHEVFLLSCQNKSTMHFFRINPNAISAVYFGHRCEHEEIERTIRKTHSLNHLRIFKMKINDYQYQLDAIPLRGENQ